MTQSIPAATATTATTPSTSATRLAAIGPTTIVLTVALTALEWWMMRQPENGAGLAATIGALAMTLPLLVARRHPVLAITLLAGAAVANGLLFGDYVRCAAAFPAVVYGAYAVGAWSRDRGHGRGWLASVGGLAVAIVAIVAQYQWDRALHADPAFLAMGTAAVGIAWGLGTGWDALMARQGRR
jgi:hypothetical protein